VFDIRIKEVPLEGIRSPDQLAAFVLKSLGLTSLKDTGDVRLLLALMNHKEGLKVDEIQQEAGLGQTATYARIRKFVEAGLIYKARGAFYKLRERTLAETLDFRVRKDIERVFAGVVEVGKELDDVQARQGRTKGTDR